MAVCNKFLTFFNIIQGNHVIYAQEFARLQAKTVSLALIQSRDSVPKITSYMQDVYPNFEIPENIDDFSAHFRISRNLFEIVLQEVYQTLKLGGTGRYEAITPDRQLLLTLWYLANLSSMREVAHIFGLSKSTVHETIFRVISAIIEHLSVRVIVWPSANRQRDIANDVQQVCRLPGIIGFLDGTHVRLSSALKGDRDYYNRKGYPSLQLQAVVDHEMRFTNIYTGWPGCVHDARVLRNSSLYRAAEAGESVLQGHHILADSAYPLRNWLIVPFKNFGNLNPQQVRFNKRLSLVRQTVERAFGHMKGRFRRIQEIPLHNIEEICNVIHAVCILHNLCIDNADNIDDYIHRDPDDDPNQNMNIYQNGQEGIIRRLQLVNIP
ncbi:uncharacterized protein LOC134244176 [Saccostrea cucullata]|uniref:uncharacterized protein LOC134244176 n=1 Tax=Saccostrea cuccullata TaxID=36930 RepID=UPI002ED35EB9